MQHARSFLLLLLGLIAVLCSFTAWTVYRERRQERLNQDLIAAVKHNDTKAVIALLDQGADANCHDEPFRPVPWWQMLRDRFQRAKLKLSTADTPLLLALCHRHEIPPENLPLVKALLDHKADVNVRDAGGVTPLGYALDNGPSATIHLLLKHGADIKPESRQGVTPLTFNVSTDVLADMLQRGADVNERDDAGDTALFAAVEEQNIEAVRLLLSYHADVTLRGLNDPTPLAEAKGELANINEVKRELARANMVGYTDDAKVQQIIRLLKQAGAKE